MCLTISYLIGLVVCTSFAKIYLYGNQTGDSVMFVTAIIAMNLVMVVPEVIRWLGEERCIGVIKNSIILFPQQSCAELVPVAVFSLRLVIFAVASVITFLVREQEARKADLVINAFGTSACFFECISSYKHEEKRRRNADKTDKMQEENRHLRDMNSKMVEELAEIKEKNRQQTPEGTFEHLKNVCFWSVFCVGLCCIVWLAIAGIVMSIKSK